jgi:tetratricopeptide (TPR) repeat protein
MGFDHFVLYDNDSTDAGADIIRASPLASHCTVTHWPERPGQLSAYRHFIRNHARRFDWAAFIDLDEFLLPLGEAGLRELLESWSGYSAVLVSWRIFGSSGWQEPPQGLVIENYDMRSADEMPVNHHIKSIVRCQDLLDVVKENPHEFRVKGQVCNTAGHPVPNTAIQPEACHVNLVLNHYVTRSRQDWMAKIRRGDAMIEKSELKYKAEMFEHFDEMSHIKDETIKKWAPSVKAILSGHAMQRGAVAVRQERQDEAQTPGLEVAYLLIRLDPGLFTLSLERNAHDETAGLPAARVSLPPEPPLQPPTVHVSPFRSDGWLTAQDEPTLIRVVSDGGQVLITFYWQAALGAAGKPRIVLRSLGAVDAAAPSAEGNIGGHAETLARQEAMLARDPDRTPAEITAHVQNVGDIKGTLGSWIGEHRSGRWIEGFKITPPPDIAPEELLYRVVIGRDRLSPWMRSGRFCGSAGLAQPLLGFCLTLRGAAAANYECSYAATFVDGSVMGFTPSGKVCAAATLAPLEAFQVDLRPRTRPLVESDGRFEEGFALHQQGKLTEVERAFRAVSRRQPDNFDARQPQATIAAQTQSGIELLNTTVQANERNALAYGNRGNALLGVKRFEEAIASYDRAIATKPDYAEAYYGRGTALLGLEHFDDAVASYDSAIVLKPDYAAAHWTRGIALLGLKRLEEAVASCDRAITLKPDYAEAYCTRSIALLELKCPEEAVASCDRAIALKPDYAEAYRNLGIALLDLQRPEEALSSYDRAIVLNSDYAEAYCIRSTTLLKLKRPEEAVASCNRAIALKPDYADAYCRRGAALRVLKRLDEAVASYERAITLKPDYAEAHHNQSFCLLQMGRYEQGWRQYEWRRSIETPVAARSYGRPRWLGEPDIFGKTLFLWWEQGFGDTIQFCRYAKLVEARGARVVMEVQQPLCRLLRQLSPGMQLIQPGEQPGEFDYHCPLLSLPLAFRTTVETIPSLARYLWAEESAVAEWSSRLVAKATQKIGLVWSGSAVHKDDNRSIDLTMCLPLLEADSGHVA